MKDGEQTLGADLLRELIRTPAARELARSLLADGASETPAVTDALLSEDPAIVFNALGRVPEVANAAARSLYIVAQSLERFPPLLAAELLQGLVAKLDGEAMEQARTACWRLLERLADDEEARRLVGRTVAGVINDALPKDTGLTEASVRLGGAVVRELDFGVLRAAVEDTARKLVRSLEPEVEGAVSDVVLLSNLLTTLPHLTNAGLSLAATVVGGLRFPPEVLASALFNLLQELDTGALARLVNGFSSMVTGAHEGSLVLGQHEPRFREVLARLLHDLLMHIDQAAVARAAVALAEDLETALQVGADRLHTDRELLTSIITAGLAALDVVLRGTGAAAERLGSLPEEAVGEVAAQLSLPGASAARLLNGGAALIRRLLDARPERYRDALGAFLDEADWVGLLEVASRLSAPALELNPGRWGHIVGEVLSGVVREMARRPGAVRAAVARLDQPDARESITKAVEELGHSLLSHPQLLQALLTPVLASLQRTAAGYLWQLPGRLRQRLLPF
jgi:hypothetical protein